MKNPITPVDATSVQNPLPPAPTTKILAISHFIGTPMTPAVGSLYALRAIGDERNPR